MSRAGQFVLVLLTAVGGVACHSQSDLLKRLDGGAAGMTGASGTGGGGGSAPDGSADGTPDGSPDAGPDPLPGYHWVALPAPQGAPMKTIAVDSQGALYASARTSLSGLTMPSGGTGIFTSRDEGASWRTANLGIVDYNVVGLAAVGTTLYAGTSSLLRSTDGGASWQEAAPFDYPEGYQYISGGGDLVAAWSGGHIWVSTDAGSTFRMTTLKQGGALSVDVVENGSAILVGTTFGVFRSTDAGATFNPVQGIFNGQGLYARLRCDGQRTCYGTGHDTPQFSDPDALLRSTDAGATWTPLSINNSYMVLAVSDTGSVYIGVGGYKMWRSDDAGVTLTEIVRPTAAGWVEPNCDGPLAARGDQVFAACADGVYRSDDKGQTWRRASGSPATGPITGAAAGIFVDASTTALGPGGDIYVNGVAGLAPDGTDNYALERSSDGGWTWQTAAPTFFSDPCTVTPGGALECLNVATPSMRVPLGRSDDHGATWTEVPLPASLSPYNGFGLATDGSIVYLAASGVARSSDDGRTFQVIP
ncbi:MAG TPA: sialidase family protein, partial [Polyangia bacterium]